MSRPGLIKRLLASKRASAAAIVAVTLPATLGAVAIGTEASLMMAMNSQLQSAADASAGAGRQKLNPFISGYQSAPELEAIQLGNTNFSSSVKAADVEQGWWDIVGKKFTGPITGGFTNAIRVTARSTYNLSFGKLVGLQSVNLKKQATAYKCSNQNFPLSVIPDDPTPPTKAASWVSWASDGNPVKTSYVYNDGGHLRPVIKFYSPVDQHLSMVVSMPGGMTLQLDTYCRGTYLIVPALFEINSSYTGVVTIKPGIIKDGDIIDSFDTYPDSDTAHALAFSTSTYYANPKTLPALAPALVHVTPFLGFLGIQYWASVGNPTPDRQAVLVY